MGTRIIYDITSGEYVEAPYEPPSEPTPEPIPIIDAIDLWQRTTDEEAEAIENYMAQAPARVRNIFRTAVTFRGDHELFAMLETAANALFSPERVAVLLEPSRYE